MKTIKAYAIILSASFLFLGCEKKMTTNTLEEELTQRMYNKALSYSSIGLSDYISAGQENNLYVKSIEGANEDNVPQWMNAYLENYLEVESIQELNEKQIIERLSKDSTISFAQKSMIVDVIAVGYYGKCLSEGVFGAITKGIPCSEKCLNAYKRKTKRALVLAVFTAGVSCVCAQVEGVALAVAGYALAMGQAEDDYYECLDNCN